MLVYSLDVNCAPLSLLWMSGTAISRAWFSVETQNAVSSAGESSQAITYPENHSSNAVRYAQPVSSFTCVMSVPQIWLENDARTPEMRYGYFLCSGDAILVFGFGIYGFYAHYPHKPLYMFAAQAFFKSIAKLVSDPARAVKWKSCPITLYSRSIRSCCSLLIRFLLS